jgi:hypothetical protein
LLFGQANGAELVFILSTLPHASTLFRSIACESGGGRSCASTNVTAVHTFASKYVESLGCKPADVGEPCFIAILLTISQFPCIENLGVHALNASIPPPTTIGADNEFYVTKFDFLVDGAVVPEQPADVGTNVPAIFGWSKQNASLCVTWLTSKQHS